MSDLILKTVGIIIITMMSISMGYGLYWLFMMAISYNASFIAIPLFVLIGYWLYLNK